MAITKKYTPLQNLSKYRVFIEDTDPTSKYFNLIEIPEVLTGGKNSFLIVGTNFLNLNTEVKIEILDVTGNTIFVQPIKNYLEGLSRVVSIEVYHDTPPGPATLIIMGQLRSDSNGNPIPAEWENVYNVRWTKQIIVDPTRKNTSRIRLYSRPELSVSEILNVFRSTTVNTITYTGSVSTAITGLSRDALVDTSVHNIYRIVSSTPIFVKAMEGGLFIATTGSATLSQSIKSVVNSTTIELSNGFSTNGTTFTEGSSSNYTISYAEPAIFSNSELTRSYANIVLSKLGVFSGEIFRAKIYVRSVDSPNDFERIADAILQSPELLSTQSYSGSIFNIQTGNFISQSIPNNYWLSAPIGSASLYNY